MDIDINRSINRKIDRNSAYFKQVVLLVQVLPFLSEHDCFALKGGTAINLFIQPFPRLSVDIDLVYLPLDDRATALSIIESELEKLANTLETRLKNVQVTHDVARGKLLIGNSEASIKIEVSLSMRGSVLPVSECEIVAPAGELFGYASVQMLNKQEVYAGKLVAALDRQHPRDLFDVKSLLDQNLIDETQVDLFLVYVLSSGRSIVDLLAPNFQDIAPLYHQHFHGMARHKVELDELLQTRIYMLATIRRLLSEKQKRFLLSVKSGQADWSLFAYPEAIKLPAIKFKLMNIDKMNEEKRKASLKKLEHIFFE